MLALQLSLSAVRQFMDDEVLKATDEALSVVLLENQRPSFKLDDVPITQDEHTLVIWADAVMGPALSAQLMWLPSDR